MMRIPIRYSKVWAWLLTLLLLPARAAYVQVDGDTVRVRMSWAFRAKFSRSLVSDVADFHLVASIGVHGWRGRWLVNGAHRPIAAIRLSEPARARVIGFPVELRELLVSVDDRAALRSALLRGV